MTEPKESTGIDGLDDMLGGGIPQGHSIVIIGACGTGKTTFGLQFLWKGLQLGQNAIFISLEEDTNSILKTAFGYGWELQPYIERKKLVLIRLEPSDAKSAVSKVRGELPEFIKTLGAKRVVIDSLSLLSMLYPESAERRTGIFTFIQQIKDAGATALVTAETGEDGQLSRDGLIEYTTDGVIILRPREEPDSGDVKLTLKIVKMRRVPHTRAIKQYEITSKGIVVHAKADIF